MGGYRLKNIKSIFTVIISLLCLPLNGAQAPLTPMSKASQSSLLQQLPLELQIPIVNALANSASWREAVNAIRALTLTSKHFYALINDEHTTNTLITLLANRWFNGNRRSAACLLRTRGAKNWFNYEVKKQWFIEHYPTHAYQIYRDFIFLVQSDHPVNRARALQLLNFGLNLKGREGAEQVTWIALNKNDLELFKKLLEAGVDPNTRGRPDGITLLERAAWTRNLKAIDILLVAGADPNPRDRDGVPLTKRLEKTIEQLPESKAAYGAILKKLKERIKT